MPGAYYTNPYTTESPLGLGLQNIAAALFKGRENERKAAGLNDLRDHQGQLADSHSALYAEQTRKAAVERRLSERLLRDQGPDAQDEMIAASAGVPSHTVRGYRDAMNGTPVPGATLEDYAPVAPRISRAMLAVKPAYADKTINPVNIAQALDILKKTADRDAMLGGTMKPEVAGPAYAASEAKPLYHFGETGAGNLFTGAQALNDLGTARAGRERATAERDRQHARTYQTEADTGVRIGAPVPIDSEAGTVWASPRGAVGQRPGIDPNRAGGRGAGGGPGGSTVTTPINPLKIDKQAAGLLLGGIDRAVGGKLADPNIEGAILARAQSYYSTPGSPTFGQHEQSARRAAMEVVPGGFESKWVGGMKPIGDVQTTLPAIAPVGPTTKDRVTTRGQPGGAPAAPTIGAPRASGRPQGKSDQQLIDEANAAINRGAPKEQALARLKTWGVRID